MSVRWSIVLAACVVLPAPAWAQSSAARASAVQLFDEAEQLMNRGDVSHACPKYAASMQLDPQLGALLHLADCYEKNGQLASAWGAFRQAEEMARSRGDDRVTIAHEYATRLEPRVSRLTIVVAEAGRVPDLELRIDGTRLSPGAWGTPNPIDPGKHVIEARAPGYESHTSRVEIASEKSDARVEIPALTPTTSTDTLPPAAEPHAPFPLRTLGWVGIGVGAVGVGFGAVFFAQRHDKLAERADVCPTLMDCTRDQGDRIHSLTDQARKADTLATVGFVAGGAFLAGGIAAVLLAPKHRSASTNSAWLVPVLAPNAGGAAGGITW